MADRKQEEFDTPDLSSRLGQRIRSARAARGMTMKQLAHGADISLPYLSRVEKGDGNISIGVLHKLAQALNLSADSLLADTEQYGADYALIVELLKRQTPSRLRELRKRLLDYLSDGQSSGEPPRRIALIGLRGAGKSTLGPLLAKRLDLPFVELNKEVEKEAGVNLGLIFSIYGQGGFRRLERLCLERIIAEYPEVVLETGGGIVVEPATYELLLHSFFNIWIYADPEEHFRRVMAQHDARIATPQLQDEAMVHITEALNERRKLYALAHASIDTTGRDLDSLLNTMEQRIDSLDSGPVRSLSTKTASRVRLPHTGQQVYKAEEVMEQKNRRIQCVAVVGAGVIGASWAAYFLSRGLSVRATDPMPGAEESLRNAIDALWPSLEKIGLSEDPDRNRLAFFAELEQALEGADFVQENGPESEQLKVDLFRRMDAALPADVVLASSSSGLLMSAVQSECRFPERVVLGHPFNPPHLIPLVEVIGGKQTSVETVRLTMEFYESIGKRPIHPRKEVKGHIANRLQAALWREAFNLIDQDVATVEDIDIAIAHGPGLRWALLGPFLNLHLSGGQGGIEHLLDHLGGPIESWWDDLGTPSMTPELKSKVVRGVQEVLDKQPSSRFVPERDRLMVDLISAKLASDSLP